MRSDKSVYKGRFENDKANGKGKVYIQETRFIFEGEWSEGIMSSGKFILTGIRIKSKEDNKYEIIFPNGSTYEG